MLAPSIHPALRRTSLLGTAAFFLVLIGERKAQAQPDLVITQVAVVSPTTAHVRVRNMGSAPAGVCRMRLDIYNKFTGQLSRRHLDWAVWRESL